MTARENQRLTTERNCHDARGFPTITSGACRIPGRLEWCAGVEAGADVILLFEAFCVRVGRWFTTEQTLESLHIVFFRVALCRRAGVGRSVEVAHNGSAAKMYAERSKGSAWLWRCDIARRSPHGLGCAPSPVPSSDADHRSLKRNQSCWRKSLFVCARATWSVEDAAADGIFAHRGRRSHVRLLGIQNCVGRRNLRVVSKAPTSGGALVLLLVSLGGSGPSMSVAFCRCAGETVRATRTSNAQHCGITCNVGGNWNDIRTCHVRSSPEVARVRVVREPTAD